MSVETEFEQDVTAIVRKVLTQEIRNVQINLEDQLTEKLQDILKRKDAEQDQKAKSHSRVPIEIAPVISVYDDTVDPVQLALHIATTQNKTIAVVYKDASNLPSLNNLDAYNERIYSVRKNWNSQTIQLRRADSPRILGPVIYFKTLNEKGGRGVSVNLVIVVHQSEGNLINLGHIERGGDEVPIDPSPYGNQSDQVWDNIFMSLPVGAVNAITSNHVFDKVKALGGVIYSDSVYVEVLRRMVQDAKHVNRRFSGQWLYYRSA